MSLNAFSLIPHGQTPYLNVDLGKGFASVLKQTIEKRNEKDQERRMQLWQKKRSRDEDGKVQNLA